MAVTIAATASVVVLFAGLVALLVVRARRRRRERQRQARALEQYEKMVEVERAARALQRARQVLAERTGNAGWNPQLEQKVHAMQLDGMTDETRSFVSRGADGEEGGPGVAVCAAAMQLVGEYGAQGAMVQVMHAAKKQLALELQELEASEGNIYPSGDLEGQVEDPEWRDRVKDQMQLKELERQLAAVDEETEDMLTEEERRRKHELEELDKEGLVTIETFPGTGHAITVRKQPRPPPRPVAWAKMSSTLHRPPASEELVQRSVEEARAVQGYSSALRAMATEVERHDLIGPASAGLQVDSGEAVQQSSQLLADQIYTGVLGPPAPHQIVAGAKCLTEDGTIIVTNTS